jgi:hypothetical protein
MRAAMQIAQPVEAFDGQSQGHQEPSDEQAVGFMMADVLQTVAILGIVEPFILDLPAGFGQTEESAAADLARGKIGGPISLDELAIGFALAIEEDAYRFPAQGFPRIKVVGVLDLDVVVTLAEDRCGSLTAKASLGGGKQLRQIGLQPRYHPQPQVVGQVQKAAAGILGVGHHIVGKTWPHLTHGASQQALSGGVLIVARAVGFHVQGEGEPECGGCGRARDGRAGTWRRYIAPG